MDSTQGLKWLTLTSGVAISMISLTHVLLGQSWLPDTQEVTASIDSQHRFYTALFLPYGAALIWVSRSVVARRLARTTGRERFRSRAVSSCSRERVSTSTAFSLVDSTPRPDRKTSVSSSSCRPIDRYRRRST